MSNNKSRYLARKTGSHLVGHPFRSEKRFEDLEEHRVFIKKITSQSSNEEAIDKFLFILKRYKTNSDIVSRICISTGLEKDELKKCLDLYSRLYKGPEELQELFGVKRW